MLKIYLARHGQDEDNAAGILNGRRDKPLTEKGLEQATEVASKIVETGLSFEKAYSSPLQRAFKTAEIITNALGMDKPEVMESLIEREFGIFTGEPVNLTKELPKDEVIDAPPITYFLDPKGAETFPELIERGKNVISEIRNKHADGNILLVSHGDIGKMIYAAFYNLDWKYVLKLFHFGNSELILLSDDSPADEAHVFEIEQHNA